MNKTSKILPGKKYTFVSSLFFQPKNNYKNSKKEHPQIKLTKIQTFHKFNKITSELTNKFILTSIFLTCFLLLAMFHMFG